MNIKLFLVLRLIEGVLIIVSNIEFKSSQMRTVLDLHDTSAGSMILPAIWQPNCLFWMSMRISSVAALLFGSHSSILARSCLLNWLTLGRVW